jgi:hypothetical protein
MKKIYSILLGILMLSITLNVKAQETNNEAPNLRLYSSFSYSNPTQGLALYKYGFGIYSNIDYSLNDYFTLRLDIGWNDYSGPEKEFVDKNGTVHTDQPNMSVWEFTAGLRAGAGPFYIEGRGGYFTGVASWGYVPAVGVIIWKLDLQASYVFAGDKEWAGIRLGYYF